MSETLYNGIELTDEWPPRDLDLASNQPPRIPYLETPPPVIPIDGGRQLLMDDFLVSSKSTMTRVFHQPVKYPCNPVMFAQTPEERPSDYAPCAVARFGVWHDDRDQRFKMWYMSGYAGGLAYAQSVDGIDWERPELDVVPGTNLILPRDIHPDSGTVWIDHASDDDTTRYKMMIREPNGRGHARFNLVNGNAPGLMMTSADGIHWSEPVPTGPMGDRSSFFYNPFRRLWVQSIRSFCDRGRSRHYHEHADFITSGRWTAGQPVGWAYADYLDPAGDSIPQLYNLDAAPYESVMLGLHQILRGPPNGIGAERAEPKLTELFAGTSRDGFHWHRPDRRPFIGARRVPGSWEFGYIEACGGGCLVVGDELWFYYCAYGGDPTRRDQPGLANGMYGHGAVGLAKLRRDGLASMQPRFAGAFLETRPVRFSGSRLFVNVNTAGAALRVGVLDLNGQPVPGYDDGQCIPYAGNCTRAAIRWREDRTLAALAGQPVCLRFKMDAGELFAFWVTDSPDGASGGYLAAGGPGIRGGRDSA